VLKSYREPEIKGLAVLGVPVDRRRLAARPVSAAHSRNCLAGPPPGGMMRLVTLAI
jgi:hypothetical protein